MRIERIKHPRSDRKPRVMRLPVFSELVSTYIEPERDTTGDDIYKYVRGIQKGRNCWI